MSDDELINKAEAFLRHGTAPEILPGDEFPRLLALARKGAALEAAQHGMGDGWKMVPVEPTEAMLRAVWFTQAKIAQAVVGGSDDNAEQLTQKYLNDPHQREVDVAAYKAMLAAAPASPVPAVDRNAVLDDDATVERVAKAIWESEMGSQIMSIAEQFREPIWNGTKDNCELWLSDDDVRVGEEDTDYDHVRKGRNTYRNSARAAIRALSTTPEAVHVNKEVDWGPDVGNEILPPYKPPEAGKEKP